MKLRIRLKFETVTLFRKLAPREHRALTILTRQRDFAACSNFDLQTRLLTSWSLTFWASSQL